MQGNPGLVNRVEQRSIQHIIETVEGGQPVFANDALFQYFSPEGADRLMRMLSSLVADTAAWGKTSAAAQTLEALQSAKKAGIGPYEGSKPAFRFSPQVTELAQSVADGRELDTARVGRLAEKELERLKLALHHVRQGMVAFGHDTSHISAQMEKLPASIMVDDARAAAQLMKEEGLLGGRGLAIAGATVVVGAITYGMSKLLGRKKPDPENWSSRLETVGAAPAEAKGV